MKTLLLTLIACSALTSCRIDGAIPLHSFGNWQDTGYRGVNDDSVQQERICSTCGLKELRILD